MLRPVPDLQSFVGAAGSGPDEILVLRLHQAVQSILTIFPEKAELVGRALGALADDLGAAPPPAPRRRRTSEGGTP